MEPRAEEKEIVGQTEEKRMEINLTASLIHMSNSLDLSYQGIMTHHQRVALLALYMGNFIGLSACEMYQLFKAAIIHDIGAVSWKEKMILHQVDVDDTYPHCYRGYQFVYDLQLFNDVKEIILCHHDHWNGNNFSGMKKGRIPLASRIIHLADRVSILVHSDSCIIDQADQIRKEIQQLAGKTFDPDLVDVFCRISRNECMWLDLVAPWTAERLYDFIPGQEEVNYLNCLRDIAQLYARAVDAKSPFTYMHSHGTALVSKFLAQK